VRSSRDCAGIVASLEHGAEVIDAAPAAAAENRRTIGQRQVGQRERDEGRDVIIAQAREKNANAFAPWTKQEEQEVKRRFEQGESLQHIARTQKRSLRATELRLQRLGFLPPAP
jgi:hypothetical protein